MLRSAPVVADSNVIVPAVRALAERHARGLQGKSRSTNGLPPTSLQTKLKSWPTRSMPRLRGWLSPAPRRRPRRCRQIQGRAGRALRGSAQDAIRYAPHRNRQNGSRQPGAAVLAGRTCVDDGRGSHRARGHALGLSGGSCRCGRARGRSRRIITNRQAATGDG